MKHIMLYVDYVPKQKQNLPSTEPSLPVSLIPESAGPKPACPGQTWTQQTPGCLKHKLLWEPEGRRSHLTSRADAGASTQQEGPQGKFRWSPATKTSWAKVCPMTRQGSLTPF